VLPVCRASAGGQKALLLTPNKIEERKVEAATEPPLLWILAFGCAIESISPSGARTRLTSRRDNDTLQVVFNPQ
jgi:hypothetical protein